VSAKLLGVTFCQNRISWMIISKYYWQSVVSAGFCLSASKVKDS